MLGLLELPLGKPFGLSGGLSGGNRGAETSRCKGVEGSMPQVRF